jgi:hypothetical protein
LNRKPVAWLVLLAIPLRCRQEIDLVGVFLIGVDEMKAFQNGSKIGEPVK